ncbi:MAG: adenylate kinase family protein [Candidatus Bathyarchaeota archaeon]|jgi:adenylate kinase
MSVQRRVIVVAGVPGVGKSTIARILSERLGYPLIGINEFAREGGLVETKDEERGTEIIDLDKLRERISEKIHDEGREVLVEGHFAYDAVPDGLVSHAFILRRAPWILKGELEARGYPHGKVRENVEAELVDVCLAEALEALDPEVVCEIDTTDRELGEVAREIQAIIEGSERCSRGSVDWLGCPEVRELIEW